MNNITRKAGRTYSDPLFKFLKREYASNLLQRGNVRVATLHEFRDTKLYGRNTTGDEDEGKLWVRNYYRLYEGYAEKANGLIPYFYRNNEFIRIQNRHFAGSISLPNMYMYCTSGLLFSGSMLQAARENKHSCVMISNPEKFFKIITEKISTRFIGYDFCVYRKKGRIIEEDNPDQNSETNRFVGRKNISKTALIKPEKYSNHKEVRAIWSNVSELPIQQQNPQFIVIGNTNLDTRLEAKILDIPEISGLCLELDMSQLNVEQIFAKQSHIIKTHIQHIDGKDSYFEIYEPFEIFSPIIIDEKKLGFRAPDNIVKGKKIIGGTYCEVGILKDNIGMIICVTPLDKIKKISFAIK